MKLTAKENKELIVKKSRNGKGIYTRRIFAPEEIVFEVTGTLTTCYEDDDIDDETRANMYPYDRVRYISPKGRLGDMLNRSCEPNAKVVKKNAKLFIAAIIPILKGVEVCIDYATILANDDVWTMKCNCGSSICRGTIKKFKTLPKALQQRYLAFGMVPRYILH